MMTSMRTLALGGALTLLLVCAVPTAAATTATGQGAGPGGGLIATEARYPAAPAGRCAADNVPPERFCGP
jgi:hypothetical protein